MKKLTKKRIEIIKFTGNKIETSIPNINNGGCGIFAHLLGQKLAEKGFKVEYVLLSYKPYTLGTINEQIKQGDYLGLLREGNWFHILTVVNDKYIDTLGVRTKQELLSYYYDNYDVEVYMSDVINFDRTDFLKEFIYADFGWNWAFDRKYVKNIKKEFDKNLVL